MGAILPIAGVIQWVSGIILAFVTARQSRQFGRKGRMPRLLAQLSLVIFALAAVELLWSVTRVSDMMERWLPTGFTTAPWQLRTLLLMSLTAWVLLGIAAAWNGSLSVAQRRRTATAELRRRTERALEGIERRSPD
ncbi:MAG TPA: hypothetical protein VJ812_13945 [Gemmatimonadaceae bacterium]|nr:hypothetical protein [Gemmatimonadaceae bacterium]